LVGCVFHVAGHADARVSRLELEPRFWVLYRVPGVQLDRIDFRSQVGVDRTLHPVPVVFERFGFYGDDFAPKRGFFYVPFGVGWKCLFVEFYFSSRGLVY
jgi:hypothetical protein